MIGQLTQNTTLRAFESDFSGGRWKPSGILVRMQEIAEDHAIILECGRCNMVEKTGLAWMLTRLHVEMYNYPSIAEDIVIKTWHGEVTRLVFPRYFSFHYPSGELLGCASSDWVLFNIWERKLERPASLPVPYQADITLAPPTRPPMRIKLPDFIQKVETRKVRYSDTDMNAHMNNARYADWICDLFDADRLASHHLSELDITYSAEAAIGQSIDLKLFEEADQFIVSGETEGKNVFSALGKWK